MGRLTLRHDAGSGHDLAAQRKLALATVEAVKPIPTDMEQMHVWMQELAKKIDADARAKQAGFQWFPFLFPLLFAVTYGIAYIITTSATH